MKTRKALLRIFYVLALFSFLSCNALAEDITSAAKKHEPITLQLVTMVEHNAEIKSMLIHSIEKANKINPDRVTNPAKTL